MVRSAAPPAPQAGKQAVGHPKIVAAAAAASIVLCLSGCATCCLLYLSQRWQSDLEDKENAPTSANLPRPSAGTYNKVVLQNVDQMQRIFELMKDNTSLQQRNHELMEENRTMVDKVKRQKRVIKVLRTERDVRAPCTAALHRYARHAAATPATARSPPPADLWQPALELPSQESREPPSQELRHQEAKAKSFDEQIFGHLLRADPQMLGDLADEFDNNPALAVPSGQWGSFL